jgi:hypothetical protein
VGGEREGSAQKTESNQVAVAREQPPRDLPPVAAAGGDDGEKS